MTLHVFFTFAALWGQGNRRRLVSAAVRKTSRCRIKSEKTFREISEHYLREYEIMTQGQRNKRYVDGQRWRCRIHLVPFFGNLGISEITAGKIQEYRIHRHREVIAKRGKPPGRSTLHQEIVTLRQVLKTALRHGWLERLAGFSEPYRLSPKTSHRAWFSPEEYKRLYKATRKRAQESKKRGFKWEAEQLHDNVLIAVNTGLRPDEAWRLQFRGLEGEPKTSFSGGVISR